MASHAGWVDLCDAALQSKFFEETSVLDKTASELYNNGSQTRAVEMLTKYCETTGDWMTKEWREFWMYCDARDITKQLN